MGIGGHILGPRKLRRLRALTGLPLDRAYIRNHHAEGVIWSDDGCRHFEIDPHTGAHKPIAEPDHWTTCDPSKRGHFKVPP